MEYFPFYMETGNRTFLVVGGGEVASRKIKAIAQYETEIHVVAPELDSMLSDYIDSKKEKIRVSHRAYKDKDLDTADYVVVATKDRGLNHWIAKSCKERKIPVNVADDREESSFIMPAIIHQNNLDIAISSSGKSPAAAAYLKKRIRNYIPDRFEELVAKLGEYRGQIQSELEDPKVRSEAFECLLSIGLVNDCMLTEDVIFDVIRHLVKENE